MPVKGHGVSHVSRLSHTSTSSFLRALSNQPLDRNVWSRTTVVRSNSAIHQLAGWWLTRGLRICRNFGPLAVAGRGHVRIWCQLHASPKIYSLEYSDREAPL